MGFSMLYIDYKFFLILGASLLYFSILLVHYLFVLCGH